VSFSQTRFSFSDSQKKAHSLVLVEGNAGQQGAAILDGKWIVLRVLPGEGRAEYQNGGLQLDLKSDRWGASWVLTCDGRESKGIPSDVKLQESVLSRLELGPSNELVDEEGADSVLRRHGWKSHEGGPVEKAGPSERNLHEMVGGFQSRVIAAPVILGLNTLVWLLMVGAGVYREPSGGSTVLSWGALYGPYIARGEVWRLLTATFLHAGLLHLASNMLALWAVGPFIERVVGSLGFLALYVVSGLFGSLASFYVNPGIVGLGASGAIFGLFGALVGLMFRYHVYVRRKDLIKYVALIMLLVIDAFIEQSHQNSSTQSRVDVSAHGGGLVAGFVCGLLMSRPVAPDRRKFRAAVIAGVGVAMVGALAFAHPRVVDVMEEIEALAKADEGAEHEIEAAFLRSERFEITQVEVADVIDREVIPKWVRASARFQGAMARAPSCHRELLRHVDEVVNLRLRMLGLISEAVRKNDHSILQVVMKQGKEAEALLRQFRADRGGE
jgi:membrane associated rhomboid family serine protease